MKRYLLSAINISGGNLQYKIIEAETTEEAQKQMENWCENIIKNHSLVVFKDKKVTEITEDMKVIRFTKTNGYTLTSEFLTNIEEWENKLQSIFANEIMIIDHFYYGNKLDMTSVILKDGNYMRYNITEKNISCSSHYCTYKQKEKFDSLEK